jgi:hypothetical protein
MEQYWIENIYDMIKGYSDLEEQKKGWIDPDDTIVSSYGEDLSMLFDDYWFDDFIKEWENENLDKQVLKELISFRDKLNEYDKKVPNGYGEWRDDEIVNDPDWMDVVNQAKKILAVWNVK